MTRSSRWTESAIREQHDGDQPGDPSGLQEDDGQVIEEYEVAEILSTMLSRKRNFVQSQQAKKAKELGRGYHSTNQSDELLGALSWVAKETRPDVAGRVALLQQTMPTPMVKASSRPTRLQRSSSGDPNLVSGSNRSHWRD